MTIAQIRKALVAALTTFLGALATGWAQHGGFPGWDAAGGMAVFAALAGLATWAVPNAKAPLPKVAAHLADTPAARMVARTAARGKPTG